MSTKQARELLALDPIDLEGALTQVLALALTAKGAAQEARLPELTDWATTYACQLDEPTVERCKERALTIADVIRSDVDGADDDEDDIATESADEPEAQLAADKRPLLWTLSVVATADPDEEFQYFDFTSEGTDPHALLERAITLASAIRNGQFGAGERAPIELEAFLMAMVGDSLYQLPFDPAQLDVHDLDDEIDEIQFAASVETADAALTTHHDLRIVDRADGMVLLRVHRAAAYPDWYLAGTEPRTGKLWALRANEAAAAGATTAAAAAALGGFEVPVEDLDRRVRAFLSAELGTVRGEDERGE